MVRFDRLFLIETCPSPSDSDIRKVDPIRGIKIDHIWYWSDEFRSRSLGKHTINVRVDPWNPGVAFALVGKNWVECVSKYRNLLCHLSWVELRYIANELRQKLSAKKLPLTEARLLAYARVLIPSNFDPRLRMQQEEARLVYQALGTAAINGAPDSNESPFKKRIPTLSSDEVLSAPTPASEGISETKTILEAEIVPPDPNESNWSFDDDFGLL
jgi:hypothetical protein